MRRQLVLQTLTVLLLFLWSSGCGFELRQFDLSNIAESVSVTGDSSQQIVRALERALEESGIEANRTASPKLRIHVFEHEFKTQPSVMSAEGGMLEYEITLQVRFEVGTPTIESDSNGIELEETQLVSVNSHNLLTTSAADRLVREELTTKIVDSILRYITQLSQHTAPPIS